MNLSPLLTIVEQALLSVQRRTKLIMEGNGNNTQLMMKLMSYKVTSLSFPWGIKTGSQDTSPLRPPQALTVFSLWRVAICNRTFNVTLTKISMTTDHISCSTNIDLV